MSAEPPAKRARTCAFEIPYPADARVDPTVTRAEDARDVWTFMRLVRAMPIREQYACKLKHGRAVLDAFYESLEGGLVKTPAQLHRALYVLDRASCGDIVVPTVKQDRDQKWHNNCHKYSADPDKFKALYRVYRKFQDHRPTKWMHQPAEYKTLRDVLNSWP